MRPEVWEKVTEIYHSALEREPAARKAFLDERCAADDFLRGEVESLLSADAEAGSFIAEPVIKDIAPLLTIEDERSLIGKNFGYYKILSRIGSGGMGEVYLAEDSRLERFVAIKTLPDSLSNHPNYLRRFETEARAISALNHPNILTIYEIGESDGVRFLAAEYVAGETLRKRLERETPSLRETLEIFVQMVSALSTAHEKGIVHRDIKPENIMLREDSLVKVLDFGLAKLIKKTVVFEEKARAGGQVNTAAGVILGTVAYMSPEQARGLPLDARADVWSLGVCLYEMLAGRLPFDGATTSDRLAAILKSELAGGDFFDEVPRELERIVGKCLSKDREKRYGNAAELLNDLRFVKDELDFAARRENLATREMRRNNAEAETRRMIKIDGQTDEANKTYTILSLERKLSEIKRRRPVLASIAAVLMTATIAAGYFIFYPGLAKDDASGVDSVAVMPFVNESDNPDAEYLSDGISESLINSLSQLPKLKIIARSSSFKYKNKDIDAREAARQLAVEAILTGRVSQRGENLQISAELIDARDETQIWGEQYNRRSSDLLAVQSEISGEIARQLRARLTNAERQQINRRETTNPEAYESVLKGRLFRSRGGAENRRKAIEYFQQAIAADPSYALAHAELSEGYRSLINNRLSDPRELLFKAEQAARRAVELDGNLAEAHYALAVVKRHRWDWDGAEREYRRAVELNPNLAAARNGYAVYLTLMKRHDEAVTEVKRARELDPLSLPINANIGYTLYFARRYDEAFEPLRKTLELDPNYPTAHSMLGSSYEGKGMYREAVAAYQESVRLGGGNSGVQIHLGAALARGGETEKARAILNQLKKAQNHVSPGELTMLYDALGERELAFASLEKAVAEHDLQLQYLGVSPSYDGLRSDPRFQDLLRRIGLPQ